MREIQLFSVEGILTWIALAVLLDACHIGGNAVYQHGRLYKN